MRRVAETQWLSYKLSMAVATAATEIGGETVWSMLYRVVRRPLTVILHERLWDGLGQAVYRKVDRMRER